VYSVSKNCPTVKREEERSMPNSETGNRRKEQGNPAQKAVLHKEEDY